MSSDRTGMPEPRPTRVLCLEDDPGQARLMQRALQRAGFDVTTAPDGPAGLALHDADPFDVVLIDHQMPGMSGVDVLRSALHHRHPPIAIMVTGNDDAAVAVTSLKMGAHDYLIKDVAGGYLQLLPLVIDDALFKRRLQQAKEKAEWLLRLQEARFRHLIQNITEVITVVDAAGTIQYVSPSIAKLLGHPSADILHRTMQDLVHPDDRDVLRACLCGTESSGMSRLRLRHRDGFWVATSASYTNLSDEPSVNGIVVVLRDDTERTAYEHGLIEAQQRAEEMSRLKSTLLANVSHEIRTPLSAIIGFAEILEQQLDGEPREFANTIALSGHRLLHTLNSILDAARLQSNSIQVTPTPFDLGSLVEGVLKMLSALAIDRGLTLEAVLPGDRSLNVVLDRDFVDRILTNLVSNALKFTDEGRVTVRLVPAGEQIQMIVEDTGIGIEPSFLPHLFDEFRQSTSEAARGRKGSGLGLYITRELVELMGGSISVESTPGQGTTFTVTLPRTLPAEQAA
ncbi:hypothetical protein AWN76_018305 [Rhodothermaceae bacterium RA]|nr:hypothetical protein AWN76_018305 [Rhodothermaceae bacterium RA]